MKIVIKRKHTQHRNIIAYDLLINNVTDAAYVIDIRNNHTTFIIYHDGMSVWGDTLESMDEVEFDFPAAIPLNEDNPEATIIRLNKLLVLK